MKIEITEKLYKSISDYCVLNNLNVNEYINDLLKKNFTIDKYGERPPILASQSNNELEKKAIEEKPKKDTIKPLEKKEAVIRVDVLEDENEEIEVAKPKRRKLS